MSWVGIVRKERRFYQDREDSGSPENPTTGSVESEVFY